MPAPETHISKHPLRAHSSVVKHWYDHIQRLVMPEGARLLL